MGISHCLNPAHLTASDDVTRGPERGAFSQTAVQGGLPRVLTFRPLLSVFTSVYEDVSWES